MAAVLVVVGLNLLLAGVSTGLAAWERHSSAADEEGSAMIFVCAAQFVNTFIVALLAFAHVPQVHFDCTRWVNSFGVVWI